MDLFTTICSFFHWASLFSSTEYQVYPQNPRQEHNSFDRRVESIQKLFAGSKLKTGVESNGEVKTNGWTDRNHTLFKVYNDKTTDTDSKHNFTADFQTSFHLQNALQKGIRFQSEFCPFSCHGVSMVTLPCHTSFPLCEPCFCDEDCKKYDDCCQWTCHFEKRNKIHLLNYQHDFTTQRKTSKFYCFQYRPNKGIKIIASCPDENRSEMSSPNSFLSSFHSTGLKENQSDTFKWHRSCEQCLTSRDTISLITSLNSGITYCNPACLQCNEPSSHGHHRGLTWRKERSCRVETFSFGGSNNKMESWHTDLGPPISHHSGSQTDLGDKAETNIKVNASQAKPYDAVSGIGTEISPFSDSGVNTDQDRGGQEKPYDAVTDDAVTGMGTEINQFYDSGGVDIKESRATGESRFDNGSTKIRKVGHGSSASEEAHFTSICQTEFVPPASVRIHGCVTPEGRDEINDCDPDVFNATLDQESRASLKSLCREGQTWPVHTENAWYKNIFCFLCQNQTPVPCSNPVFHDHASWDPIVEFTLATLTDISGSDDSFDEEVFDEDDGNEPTILENWTVEREGGSIVREKLDSGDVEGSELFTHFQCPDGLWDSFLTNDCIPIRCSNGRQLKTTVTGSKLEWSCELSGGDVKNKTSDEQNDFKFPRSVKQEKDDPDWSSSMVLYAVELWWLLDERTDRNDDAGVDSDDTNKFSNKYRYGCGPHHFSAEDYPNVTSNGDGKTDDIAQHHDNATVWGHWCSSNSKLYTPFKHFMPQEITHHDMLLDILLQDEQTIPDNQSKFDKSSIRSRRPGLTKAKNSGQVQRTSNDSLWYLYPKEQRSKKVEQSLVEETAMKLFHLNISFFLFSVSSNHKLKDIDSSLVRFGVYYILPKDSMERKRIEIGMLDTFSKPHKISVDNRSYSFQGILSNSLSQSHDVTDKTFYSCRQNDRKRAQCCQPRTMVTFKDGLRGFVRCALPTGRVVSFSLATVCPHVALNKSMFNNTEHFYLVHQGLDFSLKSNEFVRSDGNTNTIIVCIAVLEKIRTTLIHKSTRRVRDFSSQWWGGLLTIIFLPLSMLCLLLTFISYVLFPILRTKPGQNNMCLIFWLFVAQGATLINPAIPRGSVYCVIMGIALHYAWLSAVAWMSACSFHMFLVFVVRKSALGPPKSHRWFLFRYAFCCNALPALFVLTIAIATRYQDSEGRVGYGGWFCYLQPGILVALTYVLPLALIMVANAILFIITVFTISRIDDIKRQAGRERRNAHVYLSLSSLTGLTGILSLISLIPGLEFVQYLSIVVNGSQGLTIFLCYTCNQRVRKMWRSLIAPRRKARTMTYTRSSSSRTGTLISNV